MVTMFKSTGLIICVLIIIIDVLAGILSLEADATQNKVRNHNPFLYDYCREPSSKALWIALASAVLLLFAHLIGSFAGGCSCFRTLEEYKAATTSKHIAVASLVSSWITLIIGFSAIIAGALENSHLRKKACMTPQRGMFLLGSVLCFLHGIFMVAYYASATISQREERMGRLDQRLSNSMNAFNDLILPV